MNQVVSVEVPAVQGGMFVVNTDKISYTAVSVMLCTGAVHKKLGVEGEDTLYGKGVSYCATCDGPFLRERKLPLWEEETVRVQKRFFFLQFVLKLF